MPFWYSFRFSFKIQSRYAPNTDAILILIQIQLSDTVQIPSRYGCHFDTHWDSAFRYSSDTIQRWMPFWNSFRFSFQIKLRYAPDTDAILILIQIQLSDTVQIRSRYGCHSDTYSDSAFRYILHTLQIQMPFWRSFSTFLKYNLDTI